MKEKRMFESADIRFSFLGLMDEILKTRLLTHIDGRINYIRNAGK